MDRYDVATTRAERSADAIGPIAGDASINKDEITGMSDRLERASSLKSIMPRIAAIMSSTEVMIFASSDVPRETRPVLKTCCRNERVIHDVAVTFTKRLRIPCAAWARLNP
jgi:hypothetical protein